MVGEHHQSPAITVMMKDDDQLEMRSESENRKTHVLASLSTSPTIMSMTSPTSEENDDLLLSCRYGDLEEVESFVKTHGQSSLVEIRDENGNCILHMVCGNGHIGEFNHSFFLMDNLTFERCFIDILEYLLPIIPPSLLSAQNSSGSTALHWAAVNSHLEAAQKLVGFPQGPGVDLIDIKNKAGHSPLAEAELAGWDEGAQWFVQVMNLGPEKEDDEDSGELRSGDAQEIEVEIEDAEGQVAKMTIGSPYIDCTKE